MSTKVRSKKSNANSLPGFRGGFTLIELFVAISMIAILMGMVIPVSLSTRNQADSVECFSNLRQINVVLHAYMNQYRGYLPHEDNGATKSPKNCGWYHVLPSLIDDETIWRCPTEDANVRSYKMNSLLEDESTPFVRANYLQPQKLIVFFDGRVDNNGVKLAPKGTWAMADDRHPDGTHLLLLNGAVVNYDSNSFGDKGWSSPGPYPWKPLQK